MGRNILIADDHGFVRAGICSALQKHMPDVTLYEACSAAEVLKFAGSSAVPLDLALVDLFMPDMDGFDFIRTLCERNPELVVVILSATEKGEHIEKTLELGARGFIAKSSAEHEFANAINIILAGGTYVSPAQERPDANQLHRVPLSQSSGNVDIDLLTRRQQEILRLLGEGLSNKQIARSLSLSENTVKVHVSAILRILNLENRTQAGLAAKG